MKSGSTNIGVESWGMRGEIGASLEEGCRDASGIGLKMKRIGFGV